jgi:hypothetical protein
MALLSAGKIESMQAMSLSKARSFSWELEQNSNNFLALLGIILTNYNSFCQFVACNYIHSIA